MGGGVIETPKEKNWENSKWMIITGQQRKEETTITSKSFIILKTTNLSKTKNDIKTKMKITFKKILYEKGGKF